MDIKRQAKEYAIEAHSGQRRKSDLDKPMVIHPINVADILSSYGFDDNVIAAGYLHDVVEDTEHTLDDIRDTFGDDIASLVEGASEPDKSLSWEERKQHTIDTIKTLDFRHKTILTADKISNLEDLRIIFELKGEYDFSAFKRGFDSQKWYYEEVYKSLTLNEEEHPMFERLKELIDYIFERKTNDEFLVNNIFNDSLNEYKTLKRLHFKKLEISKLRTFINNDPYVIEFTGTPRTGKTTLLNNLSDFFKKGDFNVDVVSEFTTSDIYKKTIKPTLKTEYKKAVMELIPENININLNKAIKSNPDIIIVDRCLFDRLIWVDRLFSKGKVTEEEYKEYMNKYLPLIKDNIDIVVDTYTDPITALKRDYLNNLSLEKRSFLNEDNVSEYNNALKNIEVLGEKESINLKKYDTTNITQRELSLRFCEDILDDMKVKLLKKVNDNKELINKR